MGYHLLNSYSLFLFLTAAVVGLLALYAVRFRDRPPTAALIVLLVGTGIWALADGLRIGALSPEAILLWNKVSYVGVALIPPALVAFVASYTDRGRWASPAVIGILSLVSVLMVLTVFTNQYHGLWRSGEVVSPGTPLPVLVEELGAVHLLWNAYVLLFIVPVAFSMLVAELRTERQSRLVRRQVLTLLAGMAIPVIASVLFTVRAFAIDLTPFGFGAMGTAFTVGMTRYRLLDIVPIGRDIALEHMDSGVLVVDRDDRIVDANEQAIELLDDAPETLVGTTLQDLIESLGYDVGRLADTVEADETVAVTRDGQTEHYDVRISPIRGPDGTTLGRVVLFSDITAQVRRRKQLKRQTEALERKNERLDEFAGIVSHDLRNPLQIIETNLELIEDPDDEDRLDRVEDATARMTDLIEQVLTLARTGERPRDPQTVDLESVVERAWRALETERATLECSVSGTVRADRSQLQRLFENLLRNAVEHAGPDVTVTVGDTDDGFYLADDGPGLPDHLVDGDGSLAAQTVTGSYGLRIVEGVVTAHGWDLRVASSPGGGTRFEITTAA